MSDNGITDQVDRSKDEPLSIEDERALDEVINPIIFDSEDYDGSSTGDIDEFEHVIEDDEDDPDVSLNFDELFTEPVDYGESEVV